MIIKLAAEYAYKIMNAKVYLHEHQTHLFNIFGLKSFRSNWGWNLGLYNNIFFDFGHFFTGIGDLRTINYPRIFKRKHFSASDNELIEHYEFFKMIMDDDLKYNITKNLMKNL